MTRWWLALGFLTRLPTRHVDATADDVAAAVRFYPLVGAMIGIIVAGAAWLGALADPWSGALLGLVAWVMVTGALHLDGLGDVADGLGAAHGDRTRLLAAMRDPHVGSFAVVAIVLQLIAKVILLHSLAGDWRIAFVPLAARIAPLGWARSVPPLGEGLGSRVTRGVRPRDLIGWGAVLAGLAIVAPALVLLPVVAIAYGLWVRHRLGGINGDAHGAGIELVESALLAAMIALG